VAHMHYSGTGKMHSFRGLLLDGGQEKIRIQGATGEIAWRITKFEIIPELVSHQSGEHLIKIYREKQSAVVTTGASVNFTEDELLGVAYAAQDDSQQYGVVSPVIIFDNALFSRNIYITHTDNFQSGVGNPCNYYIELEEVKVSAAGMAQLAVAAARRVVVTD